MTYLEALKAAKQWTEGINPQDEGWRGVMAFLINRIEFLERNNSDIHALLRKKKDEVEALSLDLGIKQQDFALNSPKPPRF
jgi:hypothetical protein